jgi:hypothetical protein
MKYRLCQTLGQCAMAVLVASQACAANPAVKASVNLPLAAYPLKAQPASGTVADKKTGLAEGPGVWMNMWSYPKEDFETYAQGLYSKGIRNLFIQTSRSNTPAIASPDKLGQLIEACHKYNIRVIAWSFAELIDPIADANKMIAAANFRSPNGHALDAIAPNLEKNLSVATVEAYSAHIRKILGPDYPLIAVIFSPLNRGPMVARTPWKVFAKHYDVIATMAYWNGKYQTLDAYTYTRQTIQKVHQLTQRPDLDVHVIGDGMGTRGNEITEFMRALRDGGAQSGSLYPNHYMTDEQYTALSRYSQFMPANAQERLGSLKSLLASNLVASPADSDPARPLGRGDFYRLVAHGLKIPAISTSQDAYDHFKKHGVIDTIAEEYPEMANDDDLVSPITHEIANRFVAVAINNQSQKQKAQPGKAKKMTPYLIMGKPNSRPDRFFVSPAYAESTKGTLGLGTEAKNKDVPINYLDAAILYKQMVQASR